MAFKVEAMSIAVLASGAEVRDLAALSGWRQWQNAGTGVGLLHQW